jgi:hypothetical protein
MNHESKYFIRLRCAYTYERQDIIQIALKRLPWSPVKEGLSDFALPLHVKIQNC